MQGLSCLAEELLTSEGGVCFMELVEVFYSDMLHILFTRLCGMLWSGCESSSFTQYNALLIFCSVS